MFWWGWRDNIFVVADGYILARFAIVDRNTFVGYTFAIADGNTFAIAGGKIFALADGINFIDADGNIFAILGEIIRHFNIIFKALKKT